MDNHFEEMLREDMERKTDSVFIPGDILEGAGRRHRRRRTVRRKLMVGGGALGVAIVAAGLVFGVTLAQGGGGASGSKPATNRSASAFTTAVATDKKALAVMYLHKTLAVTTPAKGEILHFKERVLEHVKSLKSVDQGRDTSQDSTYESWSTDDPKWVVRQICGSADGTVEIDKLMNYTGLIIDYIPARYTPASINHDVKSVYHDKPSEKNPFGKNSEFTDSIQRGLNSGQSTVDGHEQINGRDAVRIVWGDPNGSCLLIDAETAVPLERRDYFPATHEYTIYRFEAYETLPRTPENLKVLDTEAFHPGVSGL